MYGPKGKRPRSSTPGGGRLEHHSIRPTIGLFVLLSLSATIAIKLMHDVRSHYTRTDTDSFKRRPASLPLMDLYGRDQWPANTSGPSNILVLSYHSSGGPMLTRLLMLMGAFAGHSSELATDASRYDGWELLEVSRLNTVLMTKNSRPGMPLWMGAGFNASRVAASDHEYYMDRMLGVVRYLKSKRPWVLQDNKMAWLAHLWMERLEDPLCVILYRSPAAVANELSQLPLQGMPDDSAYQLHLQQWTDALLSSLKACNAVPTLVFPYILLTPAYIEQGAALLFSHLQQAGVESLSLPTYKQFEQQYERAFGYRSKPSEKENQGTRLSADFGGLQMKQDWVDFESSEDEGTSSSSSSSGEVLRRSSMPTDTLVLDDVLRKHMREVLPVPKKSHKYNTVAGELYLQFEHKMEAVTEKLNGRGKSGWLQRHLRGGGKGTT